MTLTIEQAEAALDAARRDEKGAEARTHGAEADLLRAKLIGYADKYPAITGFSSSAYWQYDDESSYYWSVSARVHAAEPLGTEERQSISGARTYTYSVEEDIADELHGSSREAWCLAAGLSLDEGRYEESGDVSVETLRAETDISSREEEGGAPTC